MLREEEAQFNRTISQGLKEFEKKYPNVKTEYISTNNYSVQEHVRLLEQAIATKPDGIAVPIVDGDPDYLRWIEASVRDRWS